MSRPRATAGGRPVVVTARLSASEAQALDSLRHGHSRSDTLRRLVLWARSEEMKVMLKRSGVVLESDSVTEQGASNTPRKPLSDSGNLDIR